MGKERCEGYAAGEMYFERGGREEEEAHVCFVMKAFR